MKLATVLREEGTGLALVDPAAGRGWLIEPPAWAPKPFDMLALIRGFRDFAPHLRPEGPGVPLADLRLLAPIPRPARNVFCVGKNYYDHAHEFANSGFDTSAGKGGDAVPDCAIYFTKVPEIVIGPGAPIPFPHGLSDQIDYEVELTVVIGKGGRAIPRERALDHVFGYTVANDVTARDLQARHKQWFIGKNIDGFCPMGPWIATADEVDLSDASVRTWVNGELRQDSNTRDLIFDVPSLIETLSAGLTLHPGDLIMTGTPAGVGLGFTPPKFLKPGDRVKMEIGGIGILENVLE